MYVFGSWMERIGFGLYQSCVNRGSVCHVIWLRWCGWCMLVGRGLGPGPGGVGWCYVCVSLDSLCSVLGRYLCI